MIGIRLKMTFVALFVSVCVPCLAAEEYSFQVVQQGTGKQTVVFIPGFACSGEIWQETVEVIKDSCTCYVLTMPGFAGVAPETCPSFEGWKRQIIRFIEAEHLVKPVLVGHSMGGGLALAVAADRSDLLKSIVVVDALPCLSALYNPSFQSQVELDCTGILQQLMALDDVQFARQQRLSAANLTTDSLLCERLVRWGTSSDRRTYARLGSVGTFFPTNGSDSGGTIQRFADSVSGIRYSRVAFHHARRLELVYQATQRSLG